MIPPLPTEILHHIIKLSLPAVSSGTYRQRYRILLAYSLVNSTWRALARKELYEELFLRSSNQVAAALRVEGAREAVKRVHFGPYEMSDVETESPTARLAEWKLPSTASELRISGLDLAEDDLHSLEHVRTLHLRWSDFGDQSPSTSISADLPPTFAVVPFLPALSTLSLVDPYLYDNAFPTWTLWLKPTTFPCLTSVSLALTGDCDTVGKNEDFLGALSLLAPQLSRFSLAEGWFTLLVEHHLPWEKYSGLRSLALLSEGHDSVPVLRVALSSLPASLSTLRISNSTDTNNGRQMADSWRQDVLGAFEVAFAKRLQSLRALRVLTVQDVEDGMSEAVAESVEELNQAMEAQGGSLEHRLGREGRDELLDWERFFEPW